MSRPFVFGCALLCVLCADVVFAQKSENAAPRFEIASIRENPSGGGRSHIWSASHEPNFRTENVPLLMLLEFAYALPQSRIVNFPAAMREKKFDIDAKADGMIDAMKHVSDDEGKQRKQEMVRALMAERFKLAAHIETRELPVYALVVARGGSKLTPSKSGGLLMNRRSNSMDGTGWTTEQLARQLALALGRVVVDKTGVDGRYDISLRWTPEEDAARVAGDANAPPSIFTALQEQLGLKLESEKGPVEVLVVDHVEMPTAN